MIPKKLWKGFTDPNASVDSLPGCKLTKRCIAATSVPERESDTQTKPQ